MLVIFLYYWVWVVLCVENDGLDWSYCCVFRNGFVFVKLVVDWMALRVDCIDG